MLALSWFRDTVTSDSFADSFSDFGSALVTGFVFISTTENYDIVYNIIDSGLFPQCIVFLVLLILVYLYLLQTFTVIPIGRYVDGPICFVHKIHASVL